VLVLAAATFSPLRAPAALATTLGFAKAFGGTMASDSAQGLAIAVAGSGKVWTTGSYTGTIDLDPGAGEVPATSVDAQDLFINQFDADGNFVNPASFFGVASDDFGRGFAVDGAGNSYFVGSVGNTMNVVKLDPTGSTGLFILTFSGPGQLFPRGIAVDGAGNVYVTGSFSGQIDFNPDPGGTTNLTSLGTQDVFAVKLSSTGTLLFAKQFGRAGSSATGRGIAVDAATNNVYLTGFFAGTIDVDPNGGETLLTSSAGSNDGYLVKLNSNLDLDFAKRFGSTGSDQGFGVVVDPASNVVLTGAFTGSVDFDPNAGNVPLNSAGAQDVFVVKLSSGGILVSAGKLGGTGDDVGLGIAVDGAGNIYVTGSFSGTADFDPSAANVPLDSAGGTDVFLVKLDATGAFVFAERFGSTGDDVGNGIAVDEPARIYLTGSFVGTVDFAPGASVTELTSNTGAPGNRAAFVVKLFQQQPTLGLPAAQQNTADDTPLVFSTANGNRISVTDPDQGSSLLRVTLSVPSGTLTLGSLTGLSFTVGDGTADASMTFSGTVAAINAALEGLTFAPVVGFSTSHLLQLTAQDLVVPSGGQVDAQHITINVTRRPVAVNDGPFTATTGATLTVSAADGVLKNDTDADTAKTQLQAAVVTGPTRGTLTLRTDGSFDYTPTGSGAGTDTFTYRVSDPQENTSTTAATATITVVAAPLAASSTFTVANGSTLNVAAPGLLAGASDADSAASSLQVEVVTLPAHGSLSVGPNGNGSFTYKPAASFVGADTFTYRVVDPQGNASTPATATVTVSAVACGPRPTVAVQTAVVGGALRATVTVVNDATGQTQNRIQTIKFGTFTNATVTLNGQAITSGQTFTAPANTTTQTFTVRRVRAGAVTTVPLTVTDACGSWPSFVGGGAGAGF
jgi:hypothetical protein